MGGKYRANQKGGLRVTPASGGCGLCQGGDGGDARDQTRSCDGHEETGGVRTTPRCSEQLVGSSGHQLPLEDRGWSRPGEGTARSSLLGK